MNVGILPSVGDYELVSFVLNFVFWKSAYTSAIPLCGVTIIIPCSVLLFILANFRCNIKISLILNAFINGSLNARNISLLRWYRSSYGDKYILHMHSYLILT